MSCNHDHRLTTSNIKIAFFLNLVFILIEVIGGIYTNSISILSDALHDLGDSISLGLSWYFQKISLRKKDNNYSYGYKRFSLLGAVVNAVVLFTGSLFIIYVSVQRLFKGAQIDPKGMLIISIIGVIINGLAFFRLKKGHSINESVVSLHFLEDVLGWVSVLIISVIMFFTDLVILDPILSILISIFILYNLFKNLKKMTKIFLQGTPDVINTESIRKKLLNIENINNIHDMHLWTLDGSYNVLSLHLVLDDVSSYLKLYKAKESTKKILREFNIEHATIEIESEGEECELLNCLDDTNYIKREEEKI